MSPVLTSGDPGPNARPGDGVRLAELLATLSLATDLGAAWPPETALRTCVLAVELARRLGLSRGEVADVYFLGLVRSVGCTSFAHEMAAAWGDDIEMRRLMDPADKATPDDLFAAARALEHGADRARGARAAAHLLSPAGKQLADRMCLVHREVGAPFAARLGLPSGVAEGLGAVYERWDGKGMPGPLAEEAIPLVARVVHVAYVAETKLREGGPALAVEVVRARRGGHFDPRMADAFLDGAGELLAMVGSGSVWDRALEAEPPPWRRLPAARLAGVLEALADFVDIKSPHTVGHSPGVAALAARAVEAAGLDGDAIEMARNAGLVHDLGRVSVSNAIWDKPAALTPPEWERVRLHPYYSERVLSATPLLAPLARLAGLHHERLDGSGYHRGVTARMLPAAARILAAADAYQALTEPRAHRPALDPSDAGRVLAGEVEAGRLDFDAVDAVCVAAGEPRVRSRRAWPAGLTDREVEVLRLVARGATARQVADALVISKRTANHHVEHIYGKLGVTSRAGAALFAVEHDLLGG